MLQPRQFDWETLQVGHFQKFHPLKFCNGFFRIRYFMHACGEIEQVVNRKLAECDTGRQIRYSMSFLSDA